MSDNPAATAAQELKKWLELLEKMLNKQESDKLSADKAKLDSDRFNSMLKELKGIKEGIDTLPDSPEKIDLLKSIDKNLQTLNDHGNKVVHELGGSQDIDGKSVLPPDANAPGLGTGLKAGDTALAATPPPLPVGGPAL
ncbi:hypothetical protein WJU23_03440 [Prosthecobacter sp. SYSU 5D2]|uniref:hypothetical protein n=1 Tax=Prosthecobacter sp. SYSU 5D2 TaxID=3134134 RepID=UPI0031FECDE5